MAIVLGISGYYHDAAAALVVDGKVVAALQEERLSRIKNDAGLPFQAAFACLSLANISIADVDRVVFYEEPFAKLERILVHLVRSFPYSFRQFPRAMASQLGTKLWVLAQISEGLGLQPTKVETVSHHQSHAASAFFAAGRKEAAVLVVDGVGEHSSTSIWHGKKNELRLLLSLDFPHSLGLFYAAITAYLGFAVNEGEYKVMGLAAWGKPSRVNELEKLITFHDDGSYELTLDYFAHMSDVSLGFGPKLEKLLGPRRHPEKPWDFSQEADLNFANLACSLQVLLEKALLGLARKAKECSGAKHLCLAGGVALNALANAKLRDQAGFESIFVQPAAGDAGGALGAAYLGAIDCGDDVFLHGKMHTAALGVPLDLTRALDLAKHLGIPCQRVSDPAQKAAQLIVDDKVLAFAQGRSEWGPRALGQRSILAKATHREMRARINRRIKHRENFRPFSPALLDEDYAEYFVQDVDDLSPWMTAVVKVSEGKKDLLGAAMHEDGSARAQSVNEKGAPDLAKVLLELKKQGHPPLVLNTSLNGPGEPIASRVEDLFAFFLKFKPDALLVGDLLLERE